MPLPDIHQMHDMCLQAATDPMSAVRGDSNCDHPDDESLILPNTVPPLEISEDDSLAEIAKTIEEAVRQWSEP